MNPVLPKNFGLSREEAWNGPEYPMRRGRRPSDRIPHDYPPLKYARGHPSGLVPESSFGRPPSLLEASFPISTFHNLNRKQHSPPLRGKSYESSDRFSLESWRMANEPLPIRRGETSGGWVKPGGRLPAGVIDAAPKSVSQRAIEIPSSPSGKPLRDPSPKDDLMLTSDVATARTKTRDGCDDEDQAKMAKIRSDLERMKQEDKEGYELLVKVLASSNESSGSPQSATVRKDPIDEDIYSTKQNFVCRPDYEVKVEGGRKFQEKSDYPKLSRSPSAPNCNAVRPSVPIKESDKKLQSLLDTPTQTSIQSRWESWRNLSSGKREASVRSLWKGQPAPPADSWRTSTVSPMASSWRNTSKTDLGTSSLRHGQPLELNMRSDLDFTHGSRAMAETFRKPTSLMSERLELPKGRIPFRR